MKKTNTNIKRASFLRWLIILLAIQVVIIVMFSTLMFNQPILREDLITRTIAVDSTEYKVEIFVGKIFSFISDSQKYTFLKIPVLGTEEYSMSDLDDNINAGDVLEISYKAGDNSNIVYEVSKNGKVMRSLDGFNQNLSNQNIAAVILLVLVEIIYFTLFAFFFIWNWKPLKLGELFSKKK